MYVKYQSNVEKHRGYITTHRVDDSYTALHKAHEDVFISIGKGGEDKSKDVIYKMDKIENNLLKNFLYVRNNGLLFNKTNVDKNGKPTIQDPDTGRPIYIGDGIIPQVEKFCHKYVYNQLTVDVMNVIINLMSQRSEQPTGNKYVFICNEKLWNDINTVLSEWLSRFKTTGTYLWSAQANKYLNVGATFNSYEIAGNTVSFKVDRTFSREWGMDKGFGMMLDLTSDKASGTPAVQMFTLKGGDFMTSKYPGVGGLDGMSSGIVSSPVAASKLINWGYSGVGVFNPYRSVIIREA